MKHKHTLLVLFISIFFIFLLTGCNEQKNKVVISSDNVNATFLKSDNNKYYIPLNIIGSKDIAFKEIQIINVLGENLDNAEFEIDYSPENKKNDYENYILNDFLLIIDFKHSNKKSTITSLKLDIDGEIFELKNLDIKFDFSVKNINQDILTSNSKLGIYPGMRDGFNFEYTATNTITIKSIKFNTLFNVTELSINNEIIEDSNNININFKNQDSIIIDVTVNSSIKTPQFYNFFDSFLVEYEYNNEIFYSISNFQIVTPLEEYPQRWQF